MSKKDFFEKPEYPLYVLAGLGILILFLAFLLDIFCHEPWIMVADVLRAISSSLFAAAILDRINEKK